MAAYAAAQTYAREHDLTGAWDEQLHAMDYLIYAYLQDARDDDARRILEELNAIQRVDPPNFKVAHASVTIPARFALERRQWLEAAALTQPAEHGRPRRAIPLPLGGSRNPSRPQRRRGPQRKYRAGAIRAGDPAGSPTRDDDRPRRIRLGPPGRDPGPHRRRLAGRGRGSAAAGAGPDAQRRRPRRRHRKTSRDAGGRPPRPRTARRTPARAPDALRTPWSNTRPPWSARPNRFVALYGAARAADLSGDPDKARRYYSALLEGPRADNDVRPEIREAQRLAVGSPRPVGRSGLPTHREPARFGRPQPTGVRHAPPHLPLDPARRRPAGRRRRGQRRRAVRRRDARPAQTAPADPYAGVGPGNRNSGVQFVGRSTVWGAHGAAATAHPRATLIGIDTLRRGGSAIDAAIAINAALGFLEPTANGIGGDAFCMLWDPAQRKVVGFNGSGNSPRGLSLETARVEEGRGRLPAAVRRGHRQRPGHGRRLVERPPALRQAAVEGRPAARRRAVRGGRAHAPADRLVPRAQHGRLRPPRPRSSRRTTTARRSTPPTAARRAVGEVFANPDLGRTYRLIAEGGRDAFYEGADRRPHRALFPAASAAG